MAEVSAALQKLYGGEREAGERLLPAEPGVFEAAAFGLTAHLQRILADDPAAVNARAADDFTPLHLAAFFGHAEAVRMLLDAGADGDAEATNSFLTRVRPLHSAAAGGHLDCCRALIEAGVDVNAAQGGGFTALAAARQNGDDVLVAELLAAGAV